ncbi:MAG: tyrosine-type recombinase/integrase, partial [Planctomycetota bacterium]
LWRGRWAKHGSATRLIRADLDAAGIAYTDEDGRDFDFHALRHQFITMLARSGVNVKDAQELARHSTVTLTLDRYAHVGIRDLGTAVAALPRIHTREKAVATGTNPADRGPRETAFRSPATPQTTPQTGRTSSANKNAELTRTGRRIPNPQVTGSNPVGGAESEGVSLGPESREKLAIDSGRAGQA